MGSQRGHEQETGIHVQTRRYRKWIRRIALGLAVTAIMAPTAQAATGAAVRYVPVCGPLFYGGAPDWLGVNTQFVPVCGPIVYGGAPDAAGVDGPAALASNEQGIGWRDAGAGVGIGATLGLLAAGAALAFKRRRRDVVGV